MSRLTDRPRMRNNLSKQGGVAALLILPGVAHAQYVPTWLVVAALSPLLVILFAVILGIVARSWKIGLRHVGRVLLWVVLFVLASFTVENDYVIWTPLVLYAVHAVIILILIVMGIAKRVAGSGETT